LDEKGEKKEAKVTLKNDEEQGIKRKPNFKEKKRALSTTTTTATNKGEETPTRMRATR
jgi:hypothetical protein